MTGFVGFCPLTETLHVGLQTRDGDDPLDADALPAFRVYDANGLLSDASGTAAYLHSGTVTNATNTTPIVITTTDAHNLTSGVTVTIASVTGNTNANTTAIITVLSGTTFSIPPAGNGAYVGGGVWHVSGLYDLPVICSEANGFEAGESYTLVVNYLIDSDARADTFSFGVV